MTNREKAEDLYSEVLQMRERAAPGFVNDCYEAIEKALAQCEADALERAACVADELSKYWTANGENGHFSGFDISEVLEGIAGRIRALKPAGGT